MITVRWHGHACFEIVASNGVVIVIDPHDGKSLGLKTPQVLADIVLITHEHFDHNAYAVVA
ncbi:MAG: MBL fold metallo-hydrolase, partial [Ignisphaera sp.]